MGFFDRFKKYNKNSSKEVQVSTDVNVCASDHNRESQLKEETIEFYDAYGTKMLISKLEWVKKIRSLPLFISELFHFYTEYQSLTFVPIIQGVGPVLSVSIEAKTPTVFI